MRQRPIRVKKKREKNNWLAMGNLWYEDDTYSAQLYFLPPFFISTSVPKQHMSGQAQEMLSCGTEFQL